MGFLRARDEIRTRDIHVGNVVLYQLSYSRNNLWSKITPFKRRKVNGVYKFVKRVLERIPIFFHFDIKSQRT